MWFSSNYDQYETHTHTCTNLIVSSIYTLILVVVLVFQDLSPLDFIRVKWCIRWIPLPIWYMGSCGFPFRIPYYKKMIMMNSMQYTVHVIYKCIYVSYNPMELSTVLDKYMSMMIHDEIRTIRLDTLNLFLIIIVHIIIVIHTIAVIIIVTFVILFVII